MIFTPPPWVPKVSGPIPETLPVGEFVLNGDPGRPPTGSGKTPFLDAITGQSRTIEEIADRVDRLARALAQEFGWSPNEGSPWDKVVAVFSLNTLDYFVVCWAVHRLNGICMPLHSSSTVGEVTTHMATAKCNTIVACANTMPTCLDAAKELEIPMSRVFQFELPEGYLQDSKPADGIKTIGNLIELGSELPPIEALKWDEGQGKTQVAYLCSTSGTSGRQKLAMLTHYGLITNIVQTTTFEGYGKGGATEVEAGAVPFSHSYGIVVAHMAAWRGDQFIVFPRFDMQFMLECVPKYKIERLYVVPPILAALVANPFLLDLYDLSSVKASVTGAAALEKHLAEKLQALRPTWNILHAWGSTETSVIATYTSPHDVWYGSSGSLLPGTQLRLVDADGKDVEGYEETGEVFFKSPNLFVGYLGNEKETAAAFDADGWHRTGDVGMMKVGAGGFEHLFIRDRIKDMIKVKGNQVVPADIEAVLATHPAVKEAAVIGIPDELAGERPRAFVVLAAAIDDADEEEVRESIDEHVQDLLHETHWLHERIDFVKDIPKSQNGKVLKKILKAQVAQEGIQNGI